MTNFLIVDNAGGHGAILAIETCAKTFLDEFNIKTTNQALNSPKTNLLDLRVWVALQSVVKRLSHRQI